ncbi:hypothetical protein NDU88_008329 [Pleurodeles waltl]|uniref:Uncharacterized protein n=1 Tax=Pleurodeles waltl TaxID=8319 RepID=A0AAV7VV65_PLEWA|nr:hypothetical protein NDU88_008329 [Pleurodeles waltl]
MAEPPSSPDHHPRPRGPQSERCRQSGPAGHSHLKACVVQKNSNRATSRQGVRDDNTQHHRPRKCRSQAHSSAALVRQASDPAQPSHSARQPSAPTGKPAPSPSSNAPSSPPDQRNHTRPLRASDPSG